MLKASRWAGNVGELAKQRSPISSPLLAASTPLPYYRVYRSAFTPPGPPTRRTLQAHGRQLEGGERKQTQGEQVTAHQRGGLSAADGMRLPAGGGGAWPGTEEG